MAGRHQPVLQRQVPELVWLQQRVAAKGSVHAWWCLVTIMVLLGANLVTIVAYSKTKSTEIASTDNQKNIVYKEYFSSVILKFKKWKTLSF